MEKATALLDRAERLRGERGTLETHWREIAELLAPFRSDFAIERTPGDKRTQKIFDATPSYAAENLSAGLWGMLTNAANAWFELRVDDAELNEVGAVKAWLADTSRRMLGAFSEGGMRFYAKALDLYSDLVHFGTAVFYVEEASPRGGVYFTSRHLDECLIAENRHEQVDTVFRRFKWTARQAAQEWGKDKLGPRLQAALDRTPDDKFDFLHAVLPASEYEPTGKKREKAHAYASVYLCYSDKHVLSEGGYYEFPFMVPRWSQRSRGVYGDSPAMLALPDVKMLNQMARTTIIGAQKSVDPPLLAPDENAVRGVRTTPGGIIYGGVDPQGRPMFHPLQTGGAAGLGLQIEEQRRTAIREAFYASLLLMVNQPGRTATEVLALQEEKMRLMGPHLGRVQSEFLDPLISRVFGILMRQGRIAPLPPELRDAGEIKARYVSPMARAQRASEAQAISRTLEIALPMAQADRGVLDNFDFSKMSRAVADAFGVPADTMRGADEAADMAQQRQQAEQMMQMAQMAPGVARAAKDGAAAAKDVQGA